MDEDRILAVDDDEMILRFAQGLLRKYGYLCDTASGVEEAAEMLKRQQYDLLISDIQMPGNTHLEFIKSRQDSGETIPVILMTGFPQIDTAIESIQLGVVAYLVKPFQADELLEKTRIALQGNRVRRLISEQGRRLQDWLKSISELEQSSGGAGGRLSLPVSSFIELTSNNIVGLISDLRRLTETVMCQQRTEEACHLLNCPRGSSLYRALRETIDVLERTKASFKSKDLGNLRKRLESLLDGSDSNFTT